MATAVAKVGAIINIDGVDYPVNEGDILNDLTYVENGQEKTITGKLRVLSASTANQNIDPHTTCPPEPYLRRYITVNGMIIDSSTEKDAVLTRISLASVVGLGSVTIADEADGSIVVGPGSSYKDLGSVVADAPDGAVVKLAAGEYTAPVVVSKSVSIVGNVPGVVLSGKIDISAAAAPAAMADTAELVPVAGGIEVEISNVKLTGDAIINVGAGVDKLVMKNCTFGGHNLTQKTMPIQIGTKDTAAPMLVVIENNVFEAENSNSYNLIDVYAKLSDGSSISGNKFMDKCCKHNQISLYGIEDDAVVTISNNYAAMSANMIRFGFIGTPVGEVVMEHNTYDATDSDPVYQGLFLVQPYGDKTTSFAGLMLRVNCTDGPKGTQLAYAYAAGKDTPFTDDNMPTVVVDSIKAPLPDNSPEATAEA